MNAGEALREAPFGVFDVETTGTDVETDRIVSAFFGIVSADGTLQEAQHWLLWPGIPIPPEATAVHGLTDEYVRDHGEHDTARGISSIADHLAARADLPLVIMNAPFDLTILDREIRRHEVGNVGDIGGPGGLWWEPRPVIDPMVLDKAVDEYRKGRRTLTALAEHYRIPLLDAHTAEADAIAAGSVARAVLADVLAKAGDDAGTVTLDDVHRWQIKWKAKQQSSLRGYFESRGNFDAAAGVSEAWPIQPYDDGEIGS